MTRPVLTRASEALTDAETTALLRDRLGDGVLDEVTEFGDHTVVVAPDAWRDAVAGCRDESLLAFDMFDCLFGVDAGEDGFDVVAVLYSTSKGRRIMLRTTCEGGRDEPRLDSVADLYPGANWMERETFDMFGIDFDGHPALLPRILTVENFEGWPLRRDFALASRVAKPWPGVSEPVETDEDGNVVRTEQAIGEAPGPSGLDEVIAKQAREVNADAGASDADPDGSAGGGSDSGGGESAREEVEMDQEVYDDLIAQGKSERIARSKAKAAFIKAQRKAERAAADAGDAGASQADPDGSAGQDADEGDGDGESADDGGQAADGEPAVDAEAAAAARAKADDARARQAEARDARAAEQAEQGPAGDADEDLEGVPEGTPVDADPDGGDTGPSHGDSGARGGPAGRDADDGAGRAEESQ